MMLYPLSSPILLPHDVPTFILIFTTRNIIVTQKEEKKDQQLFSLLLGSRRWHYYFPTLTLIAKSCWEAFPLGCNYTDTNVTNT